MYVFHAFMIRGVLTGHIRLICVVPKEMSVSGVWWAAGGILYVTGCRDLQISIYAGAQFVIKSVLRWSICNVLPQFNVSGLNGSILCNNVLLDCMVFLLLRLWAIVRE